MNKTRRMSLIVILIFATLSSLFTGCGAQKISDTGATKELKNEYNNYDYWEKENQIKVVTSFSINELPYEEEFNVLGNQALGEKESKQVKKLQKGIIDFFKEKYEIDLTEEIAKQEIKIFSSNQIDNITMGYVYNEYPNILNLNELLLTDYKDLFNNTYVHETLHQLGIRNNDDGMLMEGITDAFTDLIMCYMGEKSFPTDIYFDVRTLAYQIIKVDKELPSLFFGEENFSIASRITQRLEGVERPYEPCKNAGEELKLLSDILYSYGIGSLICETDPYFYAYDAQEIVRAYCQTFSPSKSEIDYIRNHYLIEDFENLMF